MKTILITIRKHKLAYKDFVDWLQNTSDVNNVSAYLTLQDRLSIGTIIEYMHYKGVNVLLGHQTAGLVLKKGYTPFKVILEHKGLKFIWIYHSKTKIPFYVGMNKAIEAFFNELNEQLKNI